LLFLQTRTSHILLDAAGLVLGLGCLLVALRSARRGKLDTAAYWLLVTLLVAFATSELAWSGETWFNAIGGVLAILLVGNLVLPRRRKTWLIVAGAFLALILIINALEPVIRPYANKAIPTLFFFDLGLTLVLLLAAVWLLYRALLVGSIRTRMLISYVALVALVAAAVGISAVYISSRHTKLRATAQLRSVATLKQAEIETWASSLQTDLELALLSRTAQEDALRLLQKETTGPDMWNTSYQRTGGWFEEFIQKTQHLEAIFLIDTDGQIVRSTDLFQEGKDWSSESVLLEGLKEPHFSYRLFSSDLDEPSMFIARPVRDQQGRAVGVIAGRASVEPLNTIVLERAGLGETGETYLVGSDGLLLTASRDKGYAPGKARIQSMGIDAALRDGENGSGLYAGYRGVPVVGAFRWLPELEVALLAEQDQSEALVATQTITRLVLGIAAVAVAAAVAASLFLTRSIAKPLANLAESAAKISEGGLAMPVPVERDDEIGALSQSFNAMTTQLRDLIEGLETEIVERTRALEQRSAHLETAAEVGRAAASILDANQLMRQAVYLIREGFGLYYVGLFQVDEDQEWAVLRAGTGEAGRMMLARGHRIKIGEGMIGWSIARAQPRIALEAGEDAMRLATTELPDTRSEAALPLRSRGRVLGALTVQSEQEDFFDEDTLTTLQTVADQVAVALDNARLFAESQAAIEAQRQVYGNISREAWLNMLRVRPDLGFHRDARGTRRITGLDEGLKTDAQTVEGVEDQGAVMLPVKIRDGLLGVVNARKSQAHGQWTAEEVELLETLVDQLGQALESARLFQETRRRAVREQLAREITEKVRAVRDVESIAQTAAEELAKALGSARGFVKLGTTNSKDE
jgi:GAF domain-containing protein/HAMP domain-containing protein